MYSPLNRQPSFGSGVITSSPLSKSHSNARVFFVNQLRFLSDNEKSQTLRPGHGLLLIKGEEGKDVKNIDDSSDYYLFDLTNEILSNISNVSIQFSNDLSILKSIYFAIMSSYISFHEYLSGSFRNLKNRIEFTTQIYKEFSSIDNLDEILKSIHLPNINNENSNETLYSILEKEKSYIKIEEIKPKLKTIKQFDIHDIEFPYSDLKETRKKFNTEWLNSNGGINRLYLDSNINVILSKLENYRNQANKLNQINNKWEEYKSDADIKEFHGMISMCLPFQIKTIYEDSLEEISRRDKFSKLLKKEIQRFKVNINDMICDENEKRNNFLNQKIQLFGRASDLLFPKIPIIRNALNNLDVSYNFENFDDYLDNTPINNGYYFDNDISTDEENEVESYNENELNELKNKLKHKSQEMKYMAIYLESSQNSEEKLKENLSLKEKLSSIEESYQNKENELEKTSFLLKNMEEKVRYLEIENYNTLSQSIQSIDQKYAMAVQANEDIHNKYKSEIINLQQQILHDKKQKEEMIKSIESFQRETTLLKNKIYSLEENNKALEELLLNKDSENEFLKSISIVQPEPIPEPSLIEEINKIKKDYQELENYNAQLKEDYERIKKRLDTSIEHNNAFKKALDNITKLYKAKSIQNDSITILPSS